MAKTAQKATTGKAKGNAKLEIVGNVCKCGCRERTASKKSFFRPGHDARFYAKYPHLRPASHGSTKKAKKVVAKKPAKKAA